MSTILDLARDSGRLPDSTPVPGSEYNYGELLDAFEAVCDPVDWRGPITAYHVPADQWPVIREAVIFFTATEPTRWLDVGERTMRVMATGYRAGPAGP
jgi:hypothetical protein